MTITELSSAPADLTARPGGSRLPRSRYSRWRALTLTSVYVLMVVHIVHWRLAGRTVAPFELNEVVYTFELGIVTAGFLFLCTAALATMIFGRFFCSWGCHILALQDLCGWILQKMGIRPRAVRSRVLLWVPAAVAFYMFLWPQVVRLWEGRPLPRPHLASDAEGWASFTTANFWRNLPTPPVILLTFGVCGFLIVYVLGSRGFCDYGCPYGAVFRLLDRLAPGRVRLKPGESCENCGVCTAVCGSHVRVHEEMERYGMIVNPACLKDLDCVSVCPDRSLFYGFGRPSLFARTKIPQPVRVHYDFALWEEALMAAVFVGVLLIFRGLYDTIPFFLSIALGVIIAYAVVVLVRLTHRSTVAFNRWVLKVESRILARGWAYGIGMGLLGLFITHSAFVRYHTYVGRRQYEQIASGHDSDSDATARAAQHFEWIDRWGLLGMESTDAVLADLYGRQSRWDAALLRLEAMLKRNPQDPTIRASLGSTLGKLERDKEALEHFEASLRVDPDQAATHYKLAGFLFDRGRAVEATNHLREAIRLRPEYAEAHYDLGALLVEAGRLEDGVTHLRRATELRPRFAEAYYNLAVALAMQGKTDEALASARQALKLNPHDQQTRSLHDILVKNSTEMLTEPP